MLFIHCLSNFEDLPPDRGYRRYGMNRTCTLLSRGLEHCHGDKTHRQLTKQDGFDTLVLESSQHVTKNDNHFRHFDLKLGLKIATL